MAEGRHLLEDERVYLAAAIRCLEAASGSVIDLPAMIRAARAAEAAAKRLPDQIATLRAGIMSPPETTFGTVAPSNEG